MASLMHWTDRVSRGNDFGLLNLTTTFGQNTWLYDARLVVIFRLSGDGIKFCSSTDFPCVHSWKIYAVPAFPTDKLAIITALTCVSRIRLQVYDTNRKHRHVLFLTPLGQRVRQPLRTERVFPPKIVLGPTYFTMSSCLLSRAYVEEQTEVMRVFLLLLHSVLFLNNC